MKGSGEWAEVAGSTELLKAVDTCLVGASGGRCDAEELEVVQVRHKVAI